MTTSSREVNTAGARDVLVDRKEDDVVAASSSDKASSLSIIVNLVTGGLGAGVLSLPWTSAGASVLTAAAITGGVLLLNGWTILILVEAAEKYQVFDLGGLLRMLPGQMGPRVEVFCNALIWVSMFLCLIGYNIILADSVTPVMSGSLLTNRTLWVIIGSLAVFPLCFLDQKYLSFGSSLCILVNIYLFGLIIWQYTTQSDSHPSICYIGIGLGSMSMFSALMMATVIQMCVLPMYESLEDRSLPKFRRILFISFGFLFLLFVGFQTLALMVYGPDVSDNILNALPQTAASNVARLGMVGVVLGVYPIMLMPMIAPLRNSQRFGSNSICNIAILFIVAAAMVVAFFVDNLGVMNVVNGSLSVGGFVALSPGLVGLYLVDKNRVSMFILIVIGCIISVVGVFLPENYVETLQCSVSK